MFERQTDIVRDGGGGDDFSLINDYKLEFLWRRWAETICGGMRLRFKKRQPWYIYAAQLCFFVLRDEVCET